MGTNYEVINQCLVVRLCGELDHHLVDQLRDQMDHHLVTGKIKHIIFDFSNVNFMDSSGIGLIVGRYKVINRLGGRIYCVSLKDSVKRILSMSGLLKIVIELDNIEMAIAAVN